MRDIQPDRSIRNIEIHHKHGQMTHPRATPQPTRRKRRSGRIWIVALIVIVVAAALGALLSALFSGASVSVTPRTAQVTLPATIQAALNAPVGTLPFSNATASLSATTTVTANGTKQVNTPAQGELTISNTYSSAPQKLIANTRFEAPDGKIYRIHDSVTVPGMQGTTAGTATVNAFADSPGPDYNRSGTTSYVIPGFKGDPRYSKITATSASMTDGFSGSQPAVAQNDLTAAKTQMETQLDSAVRQSFAANVPEGYELIPGTLTVSFSDISQSDAGNNKAALNETATANGDILRLSDLAAAVAKLTVQDYKGEAVAFANSDSIQLNASSTPGAQSALTLSLGGGDTTLVWQVDPNAIKQALVGQPKSKFEEVIKGLEPAIAKADASIRPFWTSTFPSDPNKISVTVVEPK
jgi:hypothetical protein